jgi:DNA-binding PadR family transcriptional regulator
MSDMHSFSVDVAKEVGVNAAILLQSIKWWCLKNRANEKHYHDGLYWTYNSVKAWQKLYPYLGKKAIDNALKKLERLGYIAVGNYNKSAYDKTKWYAITQSGLALFDETVVTQKGEMDFPKGEMEEPQKGNGEDQKGKPIPVTNQLHSNSSKERKKPSTFDAIISERTDNPELIKAIGEFIRMRSRIKKPLTDYALQLRLNKLWKLGKTDEERIAIVEQSVGACWQDFYELKDAPKNKTEDSYGFDPSKYNYF